MNHLSDDNLLGFPQGIDVNVTARCNLNCSFCWGPNHKMPDLLSLKDWENIITFFASRGTNSIVFTGGEPLLRRDLLELIHICKSLNMRVTLSTNGILLPKYAKSILPLIDEIGIPLDGSNRINNERMRIGRKSHFQCVMEALKLLLSYPKVELTVRTVVSKVNMGDLTEIGEILNSSARNLRWKLYEFAPLSYGEVNKEEHFLTTSVFREITTPLKGLFPKLNIDAYEFSNQSGRYVFIGPTGDVFGIDTNGKHKVVSNFKSSTQNDIVDAIQSILDMKRNILHATHKITPLTNIL